MRDHLTELCDLVGVDGFITGGIVARGGWHAHSPINDPIKFFAVVGGHLRLVTDGIDEPIAMTPGDVVILAGRSWIEFTAGESPRAEVGPESDFTAPPFTTRTADDDVLLGGCVSLNDAGRALLGASFPPVTLIRAADVDAHGLRDVLHRLLDEATQGRPGAGFAIRQYARLLLLGLLRAYAGQSDLPAGILRLQADERLRPALDLMHAEPARNWVLDDLARASAMSRTSFAERFRGTAGMPPLTYLARWRMLLAQQALRERDARVGELATMLGYGSESAFSIAFKRIVGESPLRYRSRWRSLEATR
jgi:AraC-like DNA-binding protein